MFQGESLVALDDKGRITVPSKYRAFVSEPDLQKGFVVTHLPFESERCVRVFTPSEWTSKIEGLRKIAATAPDPEGFVQVMMAHTETVEMDSQYRILLPARLMAYANLERGTELVMVGAINHMQIWNKRQWSETVETASRHIQDKSSAIRGLMGGYRSPEE